MAVSHFLHNSKCEENNLPTSAGKYEAVRSALFTDQRKAKLLKIWKYQLKVWKYDGASSVYHLDWTSFSCAGFISIIQCGKKRHSPSPPGKWWLVKIHQNQVCGWVDPTSQTWNKSVQRWKCLKCILLFILNETPPCKLSSYKIYTLSKYSALNGQKCLNTPIHRLLCAFGLRLFFNALCSAPPFHCRENLMLHQW